MDDSKKYTKETVLFEITKEIKEEMIKRKILPKYITIHDVVDILKYLDKLEFYYERYTIFEKITGHKSPNIPISIHKILKRCNTKEYLYN
jgi:hypothetical protein